jgi:hypothetical protein
LPDENAKADVFTFGSGDIFQLAKPDLNLSRCIADIHRIGGVSARLHGLGNEILRAIKRFLWLKHDSHLGAGGYSVNQTAFKKR